jgi:hypothetical protein
VDGNAAVLAARCNRGPATGLTLAACHAAGCAHRECAAAARAHRRTTPPVPAAGTTRRLRALAYNGFSVPDLAGRLGTGVTAGALRWIMTGRPSGVPSALAASVSALYDAVWHLWGGCTNAADAAAAAGWAPPMAWDDDMPGDPWYTGYGIDDPDAVPAPGWQRRPVRNRLSDADKAAELAELVRHGMTLNRAAIRLGLSGDALTRVRGLVAVAS